MINVLLTGSEFLLGLGLELFLGAPFDDNVYELGSNIDLLTVCGLDTGGGGADDGGEGALCDVNEGGPLGGGGGGAAAGDACPAARIAACMAILCKPFICEDCGELGAGEGGGGGAEERVGAIGGLGAAMGGGGAAAFGGGGADVGTGGAAEGGGGGA